MLCMPMSRSGNMRSIALWSGVVYRHSDFKLFQSDVIFLEKSLLFQEGFLENDNEALKLFFRIWWHHFIQIFIT